MPHYHIDDDFSKIQGINNNLNRFVMDHLCGLIDDDKDWVIVISLSVRWDWQTHDKIY